jgi:hypothetical protein
MFINKLNKFTFNLLNLWKTIFLFFAISPAYSQQLIKGTVCEKDTNTVMPFVYIINKSNGNGTMSDNDGHFSLYSNPNDTLICSYTGYAKLFQPVSKLVKNSKGEVKLVMSQRLINLNTIVVTTFKIKPYERDYMKKIIDESKFQKLNYLSSPITALYMTYSKEGRQIRKLAAIFENLMIEEAVQLKLSPEILRQLTGDDKIDYEAFRKYCYGVSNQFIISHEGVELYSKVMDCYKRWKVERVRNR